MVQVVAAQIGDGGFAPWYFGGCAHRVRDATAGEWRLRPREVGNVQPRVAAVPNCGWVQFTLWGGNFAHRGVEAVPIGVWGLCHPGCLLAIPLRPWEICPEDYGTVPKATVVAVATVMVGAVYTKGLGLCPPGVGLS
jgi:hypothetical protein